jgi:hypothetical protein
MTPRWNQHRMQHPTRGVDPSSAENRPARAPMQGVPRWNLDPVLSVPRPGARGFTARWVRSLRDSVRIARVAPVVPHHPLDGSRAVDARSRRRHSIIDGRSAPGDVFGGRVCSPPALGCRVEAVRCVMIRCASGARGRSTARPRGAIVSEGKAKCSWARTRVRLPGPSRRVGGAARPSHPAPQAARAEEPLQLPGLTVHAPETLHIFTSPPWTQQFTRHSRSWR